MTAEPLPLNLVPLVKKAKNPCENGCKGCGCSADRAARGELPASAPTTSKPPLPMMPVRATPEPRG